MRQAWFGVISLLTFLPLLTVGAYAAEYERPMPSKGGQPTSADLQIYDGVSHSVTVQLLNLTPYDIEFDYIPGVTWSITSQDEAMMQDDSRFVEKSFMFVPVGIPSLIPRVPEQNFLGPGDPGYDPDYLDTTTHPYSMVFSWDDQGGFVEDNWVEWTIKEVEYLWCDRRNENCEPRTQDVPLGLWMYRNKPTFNLSSSFLPVLVDALALTFKTVGLVLTPESPTAWMKEFLAVKELAQDSAEFVKQNTQENDGNKMWVASYIIPNQTSQCVAAQQMGLTCNPEIMTNVSDKTTGDAVYVHWSAEWAGPEEPDGSTSQYAAEQKLVVSVHVLRGQRAKQCDPAFYPKHCPLGSEPIVMITVMRSVDFKVGVLAGIAPNQTLPGQTPTSPVRQFLLQAGAGKIQQLLAKQGRPGLLLLRSILLELSPDQTNVLEQMSSHMAAGRRPTQQERQLVHFIGRELQARLHEAGLK
jgi:hypothetical protein